MNVCTYFVSIMSTFHLHKLLFSFLFSPTQIKNTKLYYQLKKHQGSAAAWRILFKSNLDFGLI